MLVRLRLFFILSVFFFLAQIANSAEPNYFHLEETELPDVKALQIDDRESFFSAISQFETTKKVFSSSEFSQSGTKLLVQNRKTPFTVIFIHGLYGNSSQFQREIRQFSILGYNIISLTLSGHGLRSSGHANVRYEDWMLSVERAVDIASLISDKIIFYGQSTGAMLSFWGSTLRPEITHLQVLIEPSFSVKAHLAKATCWFRRLVPTAQKISGLASLFVQPDITQIEQPISLNMGCQVHCMARDLLPSLKRKYKLVDKPNGSVESVFDGFRVNSRSLFHTNVVPSIVAWSDQDAVVDHRAIELAAGIMNSQSFTGDDLGLFRSTNHGSGVQYAMSWYAHNPDFSAIWSDDKHPGATAILRSTLRDPVQKQEAASRINFQFLDKYSRLYRSYMKRFQAFSERVANANGSIDSFNAFKRSYLPRLKLHYGKNRKVIENLCRLQGEPISEDFLQICSVFTGFDYFLKKYVNLTEFSISDFSEMQSRRAVNPKTSAEKESDKIKTDGKEIDKEKLAILERLVAFYHPEVKVSNPTSTLDLVSMNAARFMLYQLFIDLTSDREFKEWLSQIEWHKYTGDNSVDLIQNGSLPESWVGHPSLQY